MNMELAGDGSSFDEGRFKQRICDLFAPQCNTQDVTILNWQAGSILVNFTIDFRHGGPTIRHMRSQLVNPIEVQDALGEDFTLVLPYRATMVEITNHRKNDDLKYFGAVFVALL